MNPFDPMPTIKAILGMTVAQDVEESIMLAELDHFEVPQCESPLHGGESDHHSGDAGFYFVKRCHHGDGYRCVAFAKWILSFPSSKCNTCGSRNKPSDLTFLPIAGQK